MIDNTVIALLNKKLRFFINYINNFFNEKNNKMFAIFIH